jgi:hypothetical protein
LPKHPEATGTVRIGKSHIRVQARGLKPGAVYIVDASALGALAFGEPDAEAVAQALENATLVSPSLLWFKMVSIYRKKMLAHPDVR